RCSSDLTRCCRHSASLVELREAERVAGVVATPGAGQVVAGASTVQHHRRRPALVPLHGDAATPDAPDAVAFAQLVEVAAPGDVLVFVLERAFCLRPPGIVLTEEASHGFPSARHAAVTQQVGLGDRAVPGDLAPL